MKNYLRFILIVSLSFCAAASIAQKKKRGPTKPSRLTADSLFTAGNFTAAIPIYEGLLKDPANVKTGQIWMSLARSYHNTKDYVNAARAYETMEKINSRAPGLRVNMAKVYSMQGNVAKAVQMIDSAVVIAGYGNFKTLDSDPEFENLRKDPGYAALRERVLNSGLPCLTMPKAREFDFWLGDWNVFLTSNMAVQTGVNHISKQTGGCVILESWESSGAHNGVSINYFDPVKGKWQQKWSGSGQDIIEFYDGEFADGAMRFKWDVPNPNGAPLRGRLTFTHMPNGNVRQHSESSPDNGKSWQTVYDFTYILRK